MPIIINNLETQQDIDDYKEWISKKQLQRLKSIKRMLESKVYKMRNLKNLDLRIQLIEEEIKSRM